MSDFDHDDAPATQISALRETLSERAMAFAGIGAWEHDLREGRMRWTAALAAMCEHDADLFKPGPDAIAPYCDPTSAAALRTAIQRARDGGAGWDLVVELTDSVGRSRKAQCRGEARRDDGRVVAILGVVIPIAETTFDALHGDAAERERLAIIEARQRIQLAADVAGVGFWERDLRTGAAVWDRITFEIYGLDPELGPPSSEQIRQLVHPDDRPALAAAWDRVLASNEPDELEYRIVQPGGRTKVCLVRVLCLHAPGGEPTQLVGAIIDLTQQRETQRQLAEYDAWLRMAGAAAGIGLFMHSGYGATRVNDLQMRQLYGFDLDGPAPSNEDFLDRVLPEDRRALLLARHRAALTDEVVEAEYRVMHPRHGVRHILTRRQRQRDPDGRVSSIVGAALDVTELRQSEIALRSAHETLKLATRTAGIGIWVRNVATGIEVWNARLFAIHGVSRADFVPSYGAWLRFVHPDDRERMRSVMEHTQSAVDSGEAEFRIVRGDGAERVLAERFVVERDARGRPRRVLGTIIDITELRDQERERSALLERLQLSAQTARIGYWEQRADRSTAFWDEGMRALYELDPDTEPSAQLWLEHVHPEDRERVRSAMSRHGVDDEFALEYRIVRRDGGVRDIADRYRVERDAQGRVVRRYGVHLDITDIRNAQRERDEIAQQLQLAGTALELGVWVWDPVRHRSVWNEQMYRLFGRDRAWFESRTWIEVVHPDDAQAAGGTLERVARDGGAFSEEFRVVHEDGSVRWISSRGFGERNAAGAVYRVIGVNVDVTERKEAEQHLRDLTVRLQLATRAAGLAVWQMEPARGGRLTADDLFLRLHGIEPLAGRRLWQAVRAVIHPDDLPLIDAAARQAARTGEPMAADYRVLLANGAIRHLALRGQYRYDDAGAPTSLQGVVFDITERVLSESAVRARDMADRANRAKTEFLSRVSHELRTPLNAILGFAQVLELDPDDRPSPRQRERIGRISEAGWHLLALIDELMDLGRIEAGMPQLALGVFSLDEVLDECAALVAADADRQRVTLQRQRRVGAPPAVRADRRRVKQVLLNLLTNAIKYNRDGGSIVVTLDREADGQASLAVRDTGIGLTPHQIDQLFQPFNRLGREAMSIEGTGIGLSISRQFVEQMGGRLTVASEPGVGSVFTVALPAADRAELDAATADPSTRPHRPPALGQRRLDVRGTVLYVEDDVQNAELVEQLLALRPNVQLLKAPDGTSGRVLAATCQPDLALIDLRLPDMTGEDFLVALRHEPGGRAIPCIAVTADAVAERATALRAAGFADIWTKPIQAATLLAELDRRLIARQRDRANHAT